MTSQFAIGVDGGGTKTHAAAYRLHSNDELGEKVGECVTGPCNVAFQPLREAFSNFLVAVDGCEVPRDRISAIGAAVAGFSFASRREQFALQLHDRFGASKIAVVPDFMAAFRGALPEGRGILIVAGTGSVAFGADGRGRHHRAGGYGYIIDDAGSGYGVGRAALAAALQEIDGTGALTTLTWRIQDDLGVRGWDALIESVYSGAVDRVRIASLAMHVSQAAHEDGDPVATRILMRAGGALAKLAQSVHSRVFDLGEPVLIARTGNLWLTGNILTNVFERSCARFAPRCEMVASTENPTYGAAIIALDSLRTA